MNSKSKAIVLYVHGKGGSAAEAEHYRPLFPEADVVGFDYHSENPWSAKAEFSEKIAALQANYDEISLIAVSIGAYFSMSADISDSHPESLADLPHRGYGAADSEHALLGGRDGGGAAGTEDHPHHFRRGSLLGVSSVRAVAPDPSGARRQKSSAAAPTPSSPSKPSAPLPDASAQASRSWRAASTGSTPPNR